jgi:hypothetical protein
LDRLPQVGGGFGSSTTSQRRTSQHPSKGSRPANYLDLMNDALPLSNSHRGLVAPPSWSGGPEHWKGTSPPSYPTQLTFLRLQLCWTGPGIGRARVLQATRFSPPFCASNLVGWARVLEGHESSKLPGLSYLSAPPSWSGGPGHWKGTSPSSYPVQPIFLCLQLGRVGTGIGRA